MLQFLPGSPVAQWQNLLAGDKEPVRLLVDDEMIVRVAGRMQEHQPQGAHLQFLPVRQPYLRRDR